jgi:hypothetical protein
MIYETRLTIPKSTTKSAPVETTLSVSVGMLRGIEISFPPGCCGLAHCVVLYFRHQVWPSNINSDFSGDDQVIKFDEDYKLIDEPLEFVLQGWNDDETFSHTITMRALVKGEEEDLKTLLAQIIGTPKVESSG